MNDIEHLSEEVYIETAEDMVVDAAIADGGIDINHVDLDDPYDIDPDELKDIDALADIDSEDVDALEDDSEEDDDIEDDDTDESDDYYTDEEDGYVNDYNNVETPGVVTPEDMKHAADTAVADDLEEDFFEAQASALAKGVEIL